MSETGFETSFSSSLKSYLRSTTRFESFSCFKTRAYTKSGLAVIKHHALHAVGILPQPVDKCMKEAWNRNKSNYHSHIPALAPVLHWKLVNLDRPQLITSAGNFMSTEFCPKIWTCTMQLSPVHSIFKKRLRVSKAETCEKSILLIPGQKVALSFVELIGNRNDVPTFCITKMRNAPRWGAPTTGGNSNSREVYSRPYHVACWWIQTQTIFEQKYSW